MADYDGLTPGQILADASVADFIKELGLGIAEAQAALDRNSIEQVALLADTTPTFSDKSLIELGLTPPFYHYQYADLEASLSLSLRIRKDFGVDLGLSAGQGAGNTTGQATVTVKFGGGEAAKGEIRLSSATIGSVTTGATVVSLVTGSPSGSNQVGIVSNRVRETAMALADKLRSNDVPEIDRAIVKMEMGPVALNPTTSLATVFEVAPNRVVVKGTASQPAWALLSLLSPVATDITLDASASPALYSAGAGTDMDSYTDAVAAGIDGLAPYSASTLVNSGEVQVEPSFDHDSYALQPADIDDLERVARLLQANSTWMLRIDGHTDLSGSAAYNVTLSRKRAEAVRDFLLAQGVQGSQMSVEALGETQPVVNTPGQNADNRRVELHLTSGPQHLVEITAGAIDWDTPGTTDLIVAAAGAGSFVEWEDDSTAVSANEAWVQLVNGTSTVRLYHTAVESGAPGSSTNVPYAPTSTSEEDVATALAAAITANVTDVEAYAEGNVVHILPPDSYARISLYTTQRDDAANGLALSTTDSLSLLAAFSGGLDAAEPTDGDTVSVGGTTFTVRSSGASFANNELNKGTDAATTAANLATVISNIAGISAAASGDKVTISGPTGTALGTNHPEAFSLSAPTIPGSGTLEGQERNRAVAWGASLGVRYSRQFAMDVTGNSTIRARLVAIPAPVELLDEIKTYLSNG